MKTKFLLIGLMLLAGCAGMPIKTGVETMTVTLKRDYHADNICSSITGKRAIACTCVRKNRCTIILNPEDTDEIWGHELRHCFDGGWHAKN